MSTKWVTPLFLSVLSFMINTQNVCAVCKQGQEQSSSEAFQTNLTKTISNPSSNRSREIVNSPFDSLEFLLSKWDTLLTEVQRQENASKEEFQLFSNFNRSYLDSEWSALFQLIKYRKVNYSNIATYLADKKQKVHALYTSFVQIEQEYPSSVEPFRHPSVVAPLPLGCNPSCTNMDFSTGNFTGWNGYYGANNSTTLAHIITGITGGVLGPVVRGAKDAATSNTYQIHLTSTANNDWFLSNFHSINMSQSSPWGTGHSAMIGDSINNGKGVAILSQEFQVTPTTNSITYAYSVFLENPAHNYFQQPFFTVVLFDQNGDTIKNCGVYNVVSGSNIPGFTGEYYPPDNRETSGGAGGDTVYWRPWTQVNVPLNDYVGQCVTIQFEVGDCALGGHCGYAYVDASCSTFTITAATPVICGNGTDILTGPAGESHYSWTGPSNSILTNDTLQNITIDSAGTYTLVITPVTGGLCKDTLTISIGRDQLSATATSVNITCNGGTGKATANASNGTSPYRYSWSPSGQTNATATGLSAGTYTVTVTDANGCAATASTTISQASGLTAIAIPISNVTCYGGANGNASVSIVGGLLPYLYIWNPSGQTNAMATGLSAGNYTVTVTDANGCTATATITITQPPILTLSTTITANVSCNGGANGSATAIAAGGPAPYAYTWNPSGQTNATATGLSAGTYTVTVTDGNGCTATTTATITQPLLVLSASTTTTANVSCNGGSNGSAIVIATGGTSPYLYVWNPSGQTNATATGLSAGTYTITVTDANGCIATTTATITQPLLALSASTTITANVGCNGGSNGSANVVAAGGTSPYVYRWNPSGQTNATATGLSAGNYTVTVTDANGCTATTNASITQPLLALSASTTITANVSCNGGSNGTANVIASGGTSPCLYIWNPSGQTNATATGLSAGTYTVTVTDANGCTATTNANITQPLQALSSSTTVIVTVRCNGGSNGSANVVASGGTGPYVYIWNPTGQTNATATGLSAGRYTVTITDANGCTATNTATITQPLLALSAITITTANVNCNGGSNGSANVVANGGTSPYVYIWNPSGQTNATATGLSAGTYTVTVTDVNGCTATSTATINQPLLALLASTTIAANVSCNGGSNGSANVIASGGTGPYAYVWNPSGQTNAIATGLSAGTYTVTTTDAHGCTATTTATISQPLLALSASISIAANVSCNGGSNGSAMATATGGTSAYNYLWAPSGQTNVTATGLSAGTYTITVTDAHGCIATASAAITQPLQALSASTTITANVSCNGGSNGSANVVASGGTSPYNYVWSPSAQTNATATGLSAGTYRVTIADAHGCTTTASATIMQPIPLTAITAAISNANCNGNTDGIAQVNAFGGTAPYNYLWTPSGQTNTIATGLSAGTYTVSVTDAHGCMALKTITITQPATLSVSVNGTQRPLCEGQPATLDAAASGGTLPYNYLWSTGATASSITVIPLVTKTYTVTITDANGCSVTDTSTAIVTPFLVSIGQNTSICPGQSKNLIVNASGGDGQYTYTWLPGNNTNQLVTVTPAASTTYTVIVTDGCNATDTVYETVTVNPLPDINFGADITRGCAPMCVQFRNFTSISSGNITQWDWSFGDGTNETSEAPSHCYSNPGQYSVVLTATSNFGCSSSAIRANLINVYAAPIAAFSATPQPTTISNPVITFNNQTSNKDTIVNWLWNFGERGDSNSSYLSGDPFHRYRDTGTYRATLTIMNNHGCVDSVAHDVIIGPDFTLFFPNAFTPNGDGINDYFFAKGTYVKDFEMYIFDRWGQKIFHTTDINEHWDGRRAGGDMCQEDVYAYIATARDVSGNIYKYTGRVTLLK